MYWGYVVTWSACKEGTPWVYSKLLGWVHTCNVTAYHNIVSWQCGRDSWPRNVSKVGYEVTLRAFSVVVSLFDRRIKGMIPLRPEQIWTCNVTLHVQTCSVRKHIIPLMRDQIPTAHRKSLQRYRVTNFWYVTRARVPSTLSRYGVTIRGYVTSVYPPLDLHVNLRGKVTNGLFVKLSENTASVNK